MTKNDLLVIVSSRKNHVSYHPELERLPHYLSNYFITNSFIMLYPKQPEQQGLKMKEVHFADRSLAKTISNKDVSVRTLKGLFRKLLKVK